MPNIIGEPFLDYVNNQINDRQTVHGSKSRTSDQLAYLNSKTAWVKLASSVKIDGTFKSTDSEIKSLHENPYQLIESPPAYKYYVSLRNQIKVPSITSAESLGSHIFPGRITISSPSISSAENFGNSKLNLNNLLEPKLSSRIDFDANIKTTNYIPILSPSNITSEVFGTTGSAQYLYKISSCNDDGESLPSNTITVSNGNTTLSSSNFVRLTLDLYDFATY